MQLIYYALNFILIIIEAISTNYIANGFFERKRTAKVHFLITFAYVFIYNIILFFIDSYVIPKYICSILLVLCWLLLICNTTFLKAFFIAAFWSSFLTSVDSLFLVLTSFFAKNESLSIIGDPFAYYLIGYCAKISEILIAVLIRTWARKVFHFQHSTWTDWLRVLFFPIATLAATVALVKIFFAEPHLAKELFVCTFILLLADLMAIFLLNYIDQQHKETVENAILRQNLKLEYEHIESMKAAFAEQRQQTHDFQNQLAVLHNLALHNASQKEFAQYLEKILSVTFPVTFYVNTNRLVIDIILSQKYASAKSKGIKFRTALTDLSDFPLPDAALVVVLTNLIDNAIEACEQLPESERYILLKMQVTPDFAILYIENPTLLPVRIKNNRVMTTKSNPIAHGYGLKNVFSMLDQHNAVYVINYNPMKSVFCFSAQIIN